MHRINMGWTMKPQEKVYRVEDDLIETMGNSLAWIVLGVLEGKTEQFEFKTKKLDNFYWFVQQEKENNDIHTYDGVKTLIDEAKGKRSHIYKACKEIPFTQLLRLAEIKGRKSSCNPHMKAYLQSGYCIIGVWIDRVLQEHYRLSVATRTEIFRMMNDWIDSYQKGYLSNKGINEMFIEDIGYDLSKGEFVKND